MKQHPLLIVLAAALVLGLMSGALIAPAQAAFPESGIVMSNPQADGLYTWDEYGLSVILPLGWQAIEGDGQQFDLALASSEAIQTGTGAFITLTFIASLGPNVTPTTAMQQVAEQVGGEVTVYMLGEIEGAAVHFTNDEMDSAHHLIVLPYDGNGTAIYMQSSSPANADPAVLEILDSLTIEPVVPDMAAVDAAWQASLSEHGTLRYGDPDAPVKMLELLDFTCGHCATYSYSVSRLMALEAETGRLQVEIVLLDIIGGPLSNLPSQATYCAAEQGKGYTAYKTLLRGYLEHGYAYAYSRDGITLLLGTDAIGLDMDALDACLNADTYGDLMRRNEARADAVGLTGTPSVLLAAGDDAPAFLTLSGGRTWGGTVPVSVLRLVIERLIDGVPFAEVLN